MARIEPSVETGVQAEIAIDRFNALQTLGRTAALLTTQAADVRRAIDLLDIDRYESPEGKVLRLTKRVRVDSFRRPQDTIRVESWDAGNSVHGARWEPVEPFSQDYSDLTERSDLGQFALLSFYGTAIDSDSEATVWVYSQNGKYRAQHDSATAYLEEIDLSDIEVDEDDSDDVVSSDEY